MTNAERYRAWYWRQKATAEGRAKLRRKWNAWTDAKLARRFAMSVLLTPIRDGADRIIARVRGER